MEPYSVSFKPSIERDLRRLPDVIVARVLARVDDLTAAPFPHGAIKLSGAERLFRIRVGDYRIVYEVDTQARQITVHYVRHRRDIYRAL